MGRIKTMLIKRTSLELFDRYKDQIKDSFDDNKKVVERYLEIPSKKLRNVVAGYLTRLKQQKTE